MLTGRRAFAGATASDAIASVLTRDPDWNALPDDTPAPVRRLLRRCLARDVARRLRHAGDARIELEELAATASSGDADVSATSAPSRATAVSYLPWAIAAVGLAAAIGFGWRLWRDGGAAAADAARTTRLELMLPAGLELFPSNATTVIASPDGRSIAFIGTSGGSRQLYLRRLDEFEAAPVRGSLGATTAAFSPDGRAVVFVTSGGELRTASLTDGLITQVARDASLLYGLTWAADGRIVYTRAGSLWSVRGTAEPQQLTKRADGEQYHAWPAVMPDGRTVLFTVETSGGSRVEALILETLERRVVLDQASRGKIGPEGRLFFYRDDRMLATAFDAAALRPIGSPALVMDNVPDLGGGIPVGDVSPAGLMVFPPDSPQRRLVWVSRDGVEEPVSEPARSYMNPRISPDGTRVVVQAGAIWVHDLRRDAIERVPTLAATANAFPMWLPDGRTVMHRSGVGLRLQDTDSGGEGRTLTGTTEFDYPGSVTADGQTAVFNRSTPDSSFDLMMAPLADMGRATPIVHTPAYEAGARLSPDGRWLVYVSNQSQRNEVYLRPFPGPERRLQVSSDGGSQAAWNPNGSEIFYRIGDRMMAVGLTFTGGDVRLSPPRQLFSRPYAYGAGITMANYDVTKDGQRFLMVRDDTVVGRLRVILNWRAETQPK
jgi:serine/threonine-protein kinase